MADEATAEKQNKKSVTKTLSDIGQPTRNRPHCKVLLLDGEYYTIPVHKKAKGEVVINELFRHLELRDLREKEYFSVYYIDESSDSKIFLNPFKQIRKQLPKNVSSGTTWELYFGVQFYATELSMLAEEITRYLYVLQMCRDIKEKRINADHSTKLQLVSLLVQANCGDYDPEEHKPGYIEPYIDMVYNPAEIPIGLPNSVIEVHKEKTGFKPSEADNAFFMIAKSLYKFGQQIFPVSDHLGQSGLIGASILGLFFHKDGRQFMNIPWQDVVTLSYRRRKIRVVYHPSKRDNTEELLYLDCSQPSAKLVWRGCVEQHTFFRLEKPTPLVKNTASSYYSFNRNSEMRFSRGRTLFQMLRSEHRQQPTDFQRSLSLRLSERSTDRKSLDDDVFLPTRDSERNKTIRDREPEPIGLPDRTSERNATIYNKEPEPIGLPDRTSIRNETMYIKETSDSYQLSEPLPAAESAQMKNRDGTYSRERSGSLQLTIEAAWKEISQENVNVEIEKTDLDQNDTTITASVEITNAPEDNKSDVEEQGKQNMSIEFNTQQEKVAMDSHLAVDVVSNSPDGANVEFSSADKHNSSFMVTMEETSPSPPPETTDEIMLEGKYRNDSIIPIDLDPMMQQYLVEKAKQDGTVSATTVNIEVGTASLTKKVSNFETSSGNDTETGVTVEAPHLDFVDM